MNLKSMKLKITGITPLLMANGLAIQDAGEETGGPKSSAIGATAADPKAAVEKLAYRTSDGKLYLPSPAFRNALLSACKGKTIKRGGKGKPLSLSPTVAGAVMCTTPECILIDPKSHKPITEYVPFKARAVNQTTKGAIVTTRPRIEKWSLVMEFTVDTDFIPQPDLIVQLLSEAGMLTGVGAWRPEKKGEFGRFQVELVSAWSVKAA